MTGTKGFLKRAMRLNSVGLGVALLLSGCESQRRESKPDAHKTAAVPVQPPVDVSNTAAQYLPPLRRSGESADGAPTLDGLLNVPSLPVLFTVNRNEDAQISVRAMVAENTPAVQALLKNLEFQPEPDSPSTLFRRVKPAERNALERAVADQVIAAAQGIDAARASWKRIHRAGHPGVVQDERGPMLASRLVYSGNPLDVAMADAGRADVNSSLFLIARDEGQPVYLRGGRVYAGRDRALRLGAYALEGVKAVPADAIQVVIGTDGKISAQRVDGSSEALGTLSIVRAARFAEKNDTYILDGAPQPADPGDLLRPGHLEYSSERSPEQILAEARSLSGTRAALEQLLVALNQPPRPGGTSATPNGNPAAIAGGPIVVHADMPWSADHLKALGINVDRTPAKTVIAATDPEALSVALVKVLGVLRQRMNIHDQNLRNAERIRDADNRINPYRRKMIKIGPQGEAVEALDPAPFPKTFKPGDPNADAEGFVLLPNVNRAVELAEFQAAIDEYKLVRQVLERIAPNQIFPDPPAPSESGGK